MRFEEYRNYYDIVILPSPEVRDVAITTSRRIHNTLGSKLVLGRRSFKPHISLYHVAVQKNNFPEMIERLRTIVARQKVASITVQRYNYQPHLKVLNIAWLQNLHESILKAINPLRNEQFPDAWDNGAKYGNIVRSVHQKNIQKYGSPIVGAIFDPHITLTLLARPNDTIAATKVVSATKYRFTPTAITVCQIGEHHSCHRVVATIPFNN